MDWTVPVYMWLSWLASYMTGASGRPSERVRASERPGWPPLAAWLAASQWLAACLVKSGRSQQEMNIVHNPKTIYSINEPSQEQATLASLPNACLPAWLAGSDMYVGHWLPWTVM